ncbi:methylisocitrate lyase [Chengkuizengella axinellae]|uniref:Methylisocitrate lyase n=1 Tax=Chengkuizengella axinellae TaxID=3064388 RepID=A0ABT9IW45_9BACL|nr:methylisocitrate lyase [Chengkuizengella sp. 2205SS18-9]MDP5273571.1 methylisocitrate lyase [Chengkuizengella sp. 2205SS18-9]
MAWLIEEGSTQSELAQRFKDLMNSNTILKIPGVHNGMAALIAKSVGFQSLYLSGAAYTASRGLPDLGIVSSDEVATCARDLIRNTNLPLLVDIDTGFGGILNVARTAREMVEARVAAVQIEDQELPKKCGHLNGKKLVSTRDMMQKIRTLKEVSPSLIVIARTDAKDVEGMEAAIERANCYVEAGADGIFPEALRSEEEFQTMNRFIKAPLLANMTEFGKTPYYTAKQFEQWGYQMVIYPVTSLRVAAKAMEQVFTEILETGTQVKSLKKMQTREELYDRILYYAYEDLDESIAQTILPRDNHPIKNKNKVK